MRQRTERLAQKCTDFGLDIRKNDSLHKPNSWEFLVNKRYHLVWCNVFKAASTSWMYNFNILAGYAPEFLRKSNIVPLELARKRYERVTVAQVIMNSSYPQCHNDETSKRFCKTENNETHFTNMLRWLRSIQIALFSRFSFVHPLFGSWKRR